jgi:hypothetical protein
MTAPLPSPAAGEVQPASHQAQPGVDPQSGSGKAAHCPICAAPITVDGQFIARECGHAVILTPEGVLISSADAEASRSRLGAWAYGRTATSDRMAARAEKWAADVAQARAESVQPARLAAASTMREAK